MALYGLPISPLWWLDEISVELEPLGFKRLQNELCIFNRNRSFLILHVDDMVVVAPTPGMVEFVISNLQRRYKLKRLGEPNLFLGIEFVRDRR